METNSSSMNFTIDFEINRIYQILDRECYRLRYKNIEDNVIFVPIRGLVVRQDIKIGFTSSYLLILASQIYFRSFKIEKIVNERISEGKDISSFIMA